MKLAFQSMLVPALLNPIASAEMFPSCHISQVVVPFHAREISLEKSALYKACGAN